MSERKKKQNRSPAVEPEKTTAPGDETPGEGKTGEEIEMIEEKDIETELAEVRLELQDCKDRMLRMAADFDNTRKRLEREREITLKYAEETILKDLLSGLDNLERALEQGRDTNNAASLLEGVEMTRNGILDTLEKFGVKPIASVGEPFDPNFHEAIAMEASVDMPENKILREFQKGYVYKDRLLRAAKVVVSKGGVPEGE